VKTETPEEAKKTSEETKKLSETAEVTVMKTEKPEAEKASEGTQINELNEPIKQEKLSETKPVEDVVASLPKEKVTEVVLTNADSVENKAVEATSKASE
jgi:hypothetical protein